jgi:hypothetical protein
MNRKPMTKPMTKNVLQQLPTKWAVAIVLCLIGYSVTQPFVNQKLGWSLPSLARLGGQAGEADADAGSTRVQRDERGETELPEQGSKSTTDSSSSTSGGSRDSSGGSSLTIDAPGDDSALRKDSRSERGPPASGSNSANRTSETNLRYGVLKDLGGENYLSPAGLRYTRGSAEGHRLKHIERHLEDQPSRPSPHGVFYGDMSQVLRWIDDAFERAEKGAKGTKKKKDRGRVVMEASFGKPIGYVGGAVGKRKGNPEAKSLRLVVDGDRVITAFPF